MHNHKHMHPEQRALGLLPGLGSAGAGPNYSTQAPNTFSFCTTVTAGVEAGPGRRADQSGENKACPNVARVSQT